VRRWLITTVIAGGCFSPNLQAGSPCDTECPGDLQCVDHVCRPPGVTADAQGADGPSIDGPPNDLDGDGIANAADNCPSRANADQHDEDSDQLGDVCDPCPYLAGTASDGDGDGVGDACDPAPLVARQHIKFFDPFTSTRPEWIFPAGATIANDHLTIPSDSETDLAVPDGELRIVVGGSISNVSMTTPHQLVLAFGFVGGGQSFHYVESYDDGAGGDIAIAKGVNGTYTGLANVTYPGAMPTGAWSMQVDESVAAQRIDDAAVLGGTAYTPISAATSPAPSLAAGPGIALYLNNAIVRFDYVFIVETMP
jgi:hypothetical protein